MKNILCKKSRFKEVLYNWIQFLADHTGSSKFRIPEDEYIPFLYFRLLTITINAEK